MSDERDLDDVFLRPPNEQADQILSGRVHPDDLGGGLAEVATLLRAAQGPATPRELSSIDVADIAARVRSSSVVPFEPTRSSRFAHRISGRAAALAAVGLIFSAGAAAAATGSLPGPIQRTLSHAYSHLTGNMSEVHNTSATTLPFDDVSSSSTTATGSGASSNVGGHALVNSASSTSSATTLPANSNAVGPNVTGPAQAGLCNAWSASGKTKNPNSPAFRNLQAAATAAGQSVDQFCAGASTTSSTASTSSTSTTANQQGGSGQGNGQGGNGQGGNGQGQNGQGGNGQGGNGQGGNGQGQSGS